MALVLVADDSSIVCEVYKDMLDLMGHQAILCSDGRQAVEAFNRRTPDLVLLDVNMPVMNGIDACKEIRRTPAGVTVPIVMISSLDEEEDVLRGLNAGADDYLAKPVKSAFLAAKLKNLLGTAALHKDDFELAKTKTVLAGRYRIIKVLGYGSHSVVFLANDSENDDREVAIKLLKRDFAVMDIAEPFVEVAKSYIATDCDTLVKIYDVGMYDSRAYLSMEYVNGGSVLSRLRARTMADWEAAKMGLDIVRALSAVKANGALHLDIKPENIMISGENYKLADFGIMIPRESATVPVGMELWSTPEYICPEYLTGDHDISARSDVYSLGVTLYQAVSGENPFAASNSASSMFRQTNLVPPPLIELDDSINQGFSDAVDAMLDKDPDQRPRLPELEEVFKKLYDYLKYASTHKAAAVKEDEDIEVPGVRAEQELSAEQQAEKNSAEKALEAVLKTSQITARRIGKELQAYKLPRSAVIILVIVLAVCVGLGIFIDRMLNARIVPVAELEGPLNKVVCVECGTVKELRFKNIRNIECSKCDAAVGLAYECRKCKKVFPLPVAKKGMSREEMLKFKQTRDRCPYCKSANTGSLKTSLDQKK